MDEVSDTQRRVFGEGVTREFLDNLNPLGPVSDDDDYDSEADSSFENEVFVSDAQQHWEENMKQLEVAVFFVLCPVIGRLIGRKTAHSLWIRFATWRWNSALAKNMFGEPKTS